MDHLDVADFIKVGPFENDEDEDDFSDDEEEVENAPEKAILLLPSNLTTQCQNQLDLGNLCKQEAALRIGQMNDALQQLKMTLGGKSLVMRKKV